MADIKDQSISYRFATAEDASTLTDIAQRAKAHWGYPQEWLDAWKQELIITSRMISEHTVWVAESGDQAVGLLVLSNDNGDAEVEHCWILPDYMGRGIGKKLIEFCLKHCREQNVTDLTVIADPNAAGFYQAVGGEPIGFVDSTPKPRQLPVFRLAV